MSKLPPTPEGRIAEAATHFDRVRGDEPSYLSVAEAAMFLGVSQKTLQRAIRGAGRPLPHIRIGRRVLLARADLDRWITAQRIVPSVMSPAMSTAAESVLQRLRGTPAEPSKRRRRDDRL